jgi:endonuclease YncB( thermonuclease family)
VSAPRFAALAAAVAAVSLWGCSGAPRPAASASAGRIVSVADGDTVTVRLASGASRRVRLLGIDSPELSATRFGSPEECGSLAALAFMEGFDGARVRLLADPGQGDRGRYGRLLRYIDSPRGRDLGGLEVARGLAIPYRYGRPARRYGRYLALARAARRARRGSWGASCAGDFHSSLPGVQDGGALALRGSGRSRARGGEGG